MKKGLVCLSLVFCFINVIAQVRSHGGEGGVDGKAYLGGDSGDLYTRNGDGSGGGKALSGEGVGERSLNGGEGLGN